MTTPITPARPAHMLVGSSVIALALGIAVPASAQTPPSGTVGATVPASGRVDPNPGGLEEIIVTARKVSENLQGVPVAITAFTANDLVRQNTQRVQDIANFTPGMTIRPASGTPSAIVIAVRGQIQTDTIATLDPSVGTYVDGVYWARAYGLNGDFLDTQSVQILKGPQGTLFGRNTTGGALLINSNNPNLSNLSGRLALTYGRFNEVQATGVINIPIVTDRLAVRLAAQSFTRDGYETNVATTGTALIGNTVVRERPIGGSPAGTKLEDRNRINLRGKIDFHPTGNLSILGSVEYFRTHEASPAREILLGLPAYTANTGAANVAPAGVTCTIGGATNACPNTTFAVGNAGPLYVGVVNGNSFATAAAAGVNILNAQAAFLAANPNLVYNNEVPYVFAETYTYSGTASLDTGFGNIKLIGAHRKVASYAGVDLDGSSYQVHFTEGQQKLHQDSAELQITGRAFSKAVDFAAGIFYFREGGFDQSISVVVPALSASVSHFYGIIDNTSSGIYGQATWHVTDRLGVTGGLRYSNDRKGLESRNNSYNRTTGLTTCSLVAATTLPLGQEIVGPVQCAVSRTDSFAGLSYTAGVDYKPTEGTLVYVKTAKGFRSGGQNLRAPSAAFFLPFQPETAYSYEIGIKSEFLDRRVRFNVAAYTSDINNIQRSTLIAQPGGGGLTATILGNAGKARVRGVETELQVALFKGFKVTATGALVDPKYVRYSDLTGDRSFERFNGISKSQFSLAADYTTDLGRTRLAAHLDYAWSAKQATDAYNFPANPNNAAIIAATTRPALGLLGARVSTSFNDDHYELAVFGRNLTNRRDFVSNLPVGPLGYVTGTRNEPATYGVTGTFRY